MTTQLNGETSGEQELVMRYPAGNGRFGRIFVTLVLGIFTAILGWLPFLAFNQLLIFAGLGLIPSLGDPSTLEDPSATWPLVAVLLVVLTPGPLVLGYFTIRAAVLGGRSGRGDSWLRLSRNGFEVNDRLRRPRRYEWREIDKFMLVATSADSEAAVVKPAKTFTEAAKDGDAGHSAFRVGFRYTPPGRRRTLANRLWRIMSGPPRDRDGTKADGLVMGYWGRPFDEAVDLMNEWLTRHKPA
jgi:hypothetical protein